MTAKTSINIKPCNIGSSEAHNKRTEEYLSHISREKFYIRTDLMANNEHWVSPDLGIATLTDRYNQIARMVKEKTGRAMQTKDRERVNKKTGKVSIVRGSTPLKEGVVVIKEDTTLEQLQLFCDACKERWGITALQIFVHRDEGHYETPNDPDSWKPNLHAHIVWDWMNHENGKSHKLQDTDMSQMQTLLAECLEMERGTSKELTGKEHLERADFIIAKQREETEQIRAETEAAVQAKEDAEVACSFYEDLSKSKEEYLNELDGEIAQKEKERDRERKTKFDGILDGVGSVVGVGKYAALKKEYKLLQDEFERLKAAFKPALNKEIEKRTKALAMELQKAEAERNSAVDERDSAVGELGRLKATYQEQLSRAVRESTAEKDRRIKMLELALKSSRLVLHTIADILYKANELFRYAVDAIVSFGKDKHKSLFSNSEAAAIKSVMREYGKTKEEQTAIGSWLCLYADSKASFTDMEWEHTKKEVTDIANGDYDWRIERGRNNNEFTR